MGIGLFLKISHIISYSPSEKVFISESIISFFLIFKDSKVSTCRSVKLTRQTLTTLSSVIQLCPALCDPMDCSMPGLPVHHQLTEFTQTHPPMSQWCHPTISSSVAPLSSCFHSFPASRSFQMSQLFTSGGQSIVVSASTSVLPMNTQDWSPLGWTGWISLLSTGLSRVFANTTV